MSDLKDYNRALLVIVSGFVALLWVLANNPELFKASIFYLVSGMLGILAYFRGNWNKF